ncbi:MAG: hypothetical protein ACJ0N6_04660 [Thermodesulfobacteriota bacterium]|nr:hypothetical protein [Deltaproteobacteria bacterium TMED58]RZP15412.1 MAG: hypothetical protein EVA30_04630 [Candidatus Dadabacteria bacterium]|tara:strand:- start:19972 stop:21603 length:1632 start_codon:yes stop_codon:yes gene_type:complete
MLEKLKVSNLSVLGEIEVAFSNGLNIASGETGAGKSLILNTLVFFPNRKFPKELIKNKNLDTKISIELRIKSKKIEEILNLNGFDVCDGDLLEIVRVISPDAVSKYYINKSKVKLDVVSNIFDNYFSFFMQGAQSFLLDKKYQIYILDKFLKVEDKLLDYNASYFEYQNCQKNYQELVNQKKEIEDKRDFFIFQLSELEKIQIHNVDEELAYIEEVQSQKLLNENKEAVTELISFIDNQAMDSIKTIENKVLKLNFNDDITKLANDLSLNINELSYQISILNSHQSIDETFDYKQEQLFLLKDLRRKYKLTTKELIEKRDQIKELFLNEPDIDIKLKDIIKKKDSLKSICLSKATDISEKRKKGSILLSKNIKEGLSNLGIPNSNWIVSFRETEINNNGIDDIEFLFSANPDFSPESLKSVASGGELSRIMLILSLEISKIFDSKIVLFDEPDVGLGGAVAEKLGEKISQLSKNSQVLCISHLPQVASFADTHLLISKRNLNGKTSISIDNLSKSDRIKEIARMLSGKKIEDEAIVLAKKMVK